MTALRMASEVAARAGAKIWLIARLLSEIDRFGRRMWLLGVLGGMISATLPAAAAKAAHCDA
jgi:hypothetical protein